MSFPSSPTPRIGRARRRALVPLLVALGAIVGLLTPTAPAGAAIALPPMPAFGRNIDVPQRYVGQSTCDPVAKPGVAAFRSLVLAAYPETGDDGIIRACSIGGQSEHKEGRAWDWMVSVTNPTQKAIADNLLAALTATDAYGNRYALARRLGLMYIIWNKQIWKAYRPDDKWAPYTGTDPHTGHVHFSFGWPGARKETTFWNPTASQGLLANAATPRPADFNADGADDQFLYAPDGTVSSIRWGVRGGTATPPVTTVSAPPGDQPLSGDFNGDGASDILWYGQGSIPDSLWAGIPGSRSFSVRPATITGTYRPVVGDFDANGVDDVFFYGPGNLPDLVRWGVKGVFATATVVSSVSGVYTPVGGDFNGDGADDIIWYGIGPLPDRLWAGGAGVRSFTSLAETIGSWAVPFAGDFDGNGQTDLFLYGTGSDADEIRWGTTRGVVPQSGTAVTVGGSWLPYVGDYDGSGTDDIVWYGSGAATDQLWSAKLATKSFTSSTLTLSGTYLPF